MFSNHPFGEPKYKRDLQNQMNTTFRNTMQQDSVYTQSPMVNAPNAQTALVDPSHTFIEMVPGGRKKKSYDFRLTDYKGNRDRKAEQL